MAARDWAGITAGLALATFGLGAYVASGGAAPPAGEAVVPVTSATTAVVETVVVEPVPVEIPGLSDAASRVLSTTGYASVSAPQDLGLPPAVRRVLESHGAVLLVPEEG